MLFSEVLMYIDLELSFVKENSEFTSDSYDPILLDAFLLQTHK